jgi:hypothetical protein
VDDCSHHRFEWVAAALVLFIIVGLVLLIVFEMGLIGNNRNTQLPFDSKQWKASPDLEIRQDMVADLEATRRLIGKTESEVTALLGTPSDVFANEGIPNSGCDHAWEYRMGPARKPSLGPNNARYVVGFVRGRVIKTWQYAD